MDLVRLAIVYDTTQAAAALQRLDSQLVTVQSRNQQVAVVSQVSDRSFRQAGRGALILAQSMATGQISAVGMAGALGHVAEVLLGPWGIALAIAVAAVTLFANRTTKAREESAKFADQLRDVKRHVDRLLNPSDEPSPFGQEIERLTDLIDELDRKVQETNKSWLTLLRGGLGTALISMGFPGLGAALLPTAPPEAAQAGRLRAQRNRLSGTSEIDTMIAEAQRGLNQIAITGRLAGELAADTIGQEVDLLAAHLEDLTKILPETSDEVQGAAANLAYMQERLRRVVQAQDLMRRGLETTADAIEDFVSRGTFAFSQFLNNILRLLYRSASDALIGSIIRVAFPSNEPTVETPTVGLPGSGRGPQLAPQLVTNVHFNVQAIDAQSTARFFEQNGARIAGIVTGQADRSRAVRRRFLRG